MGSCDPVIVHPDPASLCATCRSLMCAALIVSPLLMIGVPGGYKHMVSADTLPMEFANSTAVGALYTVSLMCM